MKMNLRTLLVVLCGLLLCSCASDRPKPDDATDAAVIKQFMRALKDCQRSGCDPSDEMASFWGAYRLPESVEPILQQGTSALPMLHKLAAAPDFTFDTLSQMTLATACIRLIEAKDLKRVARVKDPKSGITVVTYTVAQTH